MKILHVNEYLSGGGVEQYLKQLFLELDGLGHQNILLYGSDSKLNKNLFKAEKFLIEKITAVHCDNLNSKLENVQKIINEKKPDLVYIHQVLNSKLIDYLTKRLPSIRFAHGFKLVCPEGTKILKSGQKICEYSLNYACQKHAYHYRCMPRNFLIGLPLIYNAKKICRIHKERSLLIVASNFMKSVLIENGFNEKTVKVNPYFTYLPTICENFRLKKSKKILALGRLVKVKGMNYLLDALRILNENVELDIVGDGPEMPTLKKMVDQYGLTEKVEFHGWLQHEKLKNMYMNCSLVIIPSIWPEPFGIIGIEAMANCKPVVAFNVGGISEWLINGKTGFLIESQNSKEMAKKIRILLKNPDLGKKLGWNGRNHVKNRFLASHHLSCLMDTFEKAERIFQHKN